MHIIFFPQSKFNVIFDTSISYQSKQHPSFKCNEIWSRNADWDFNLLLPTLKATRVLSVFSSSALDNKCFFYTSFSYSFILFFFSTLHKSKEPPEETFFLAPFEVFPTLFPHMPALFSHDVFMGKYYFNNIKVLSHIKDHQGSQASLLLKTGTKWWSLWSSGYFL